jgi:hypothetical protein
MASQDKRHSKNSTPLSAGYLLARVRKWFADLPDHRIGACSIPLVDALMSGLAVFGLKYPSLLRFDEHKEEKVIRHNLRTLYGVEKAPSDTQLRVILDGVRPEGIGLVFQELHRVAEEQGVFKCYEYLDGYHVVSIDGTGHFCSGAVSRAIA